MIMIELEALNWSFQLLFYIYDMFKGKVIKNYFSEEDDEIEDLIDEKMNEKGIDIPIYMFREVIREKGEGWDIVQINN